MGPLIQLNNCSCAKEVVFAQALDHEWMPFRLQSPTHCQYMGDGTQFNRQGQCLRNKFPEPWIWNIPLQEFL